MKMINANSRYRYLITILFLILALGFESCSKKVIRRNRQGKRARFKPRAYFSTIKKKTVLLPFFNEAPYGGEDLAIVANAELKKEMSRTGEFLIDSVSQKIFGSSKEVYVGGGVKLVQLARKAKVTGINFVVFGRIIEARIREKTDEIGMIRKTKSYAESQVEIRIFDVNSNKEIFTKTLRGQADDSSFNFFAVNKEDRLNYRRNLLRYVVRVAVRRSIPSILEVAAKLDWVGRVAKIVGNKIYVNAGRRSGIQVSDVLKVVTEGSEIYDPETGALIGISKGEIKGTIEVIDYFGPDGSIAILHSGGSVSEGDFVQLY